MTTRKNINGVNVEQLFQTIDAIKVTSKIAQFKFSARNRWLGGGHNRTTISEFDGACQRHTRQQPFVFDNDEPPVLLGKDVGANPVEFVLHALAGCLTTSLVYHAAARGIKIEEVESTYEGDLDLHGFLGLDPKVRNGYQQIRVTFKVKADAPEEKLQELVELAQKRSPVFDIVTHGVPVKVELAKAAPAALAAA
jgi:uncharacterized OsmC-like protein